MDRSPMERALSTDVVVDIVMQHLRERDLLNCRGVSKFCNKAASSMLRRRSTMIQKIANEENLMELQECLKKSPDFPFAGLFFDEPWRLNSAGAMEFFKKYGARFTRLRVSSLTIRLQDLAPFINHLPRLSILEAEAGYPYIDPPVIELLDLDAGREEGNILKLSSVRTIRLCPSLPGVNQDILREIFAAASPSLRIECLYTTYKNLKAFKRVGKLQAVSVIDQYNRESEKVHALRVDKWLSTESPALTKLTFHTAGCISLKGLMYLLNSSQHTLKELSLSEMCPSHFSSECPVLAKLTKLSVWITDGYEYIFQGSHGYKFPALKELKLDPADHLRDRSRNTSLSDSLFIVPSLTTIEFDGLVCKDRIEDLARSFPNVIEMQLDACYFEWYGDSDPFDIWSTGAFKLLEKLRILHYPIKSPTKNYINMDSFLTGMSVGICENLRKHEQLNLIESPWNELSRINPSILQLNSLKELVLTVRLEDGLEELPEEPPFMSMVSVWYALQMMPNLQVKFMHDYRWLPGYFEEERKEKDVKNLKAAFKHVQPYVELKPFFY